MSFFCTEIKTKESGVQQIYNLSEVQNFLSDPHIFFEWFLW